MRFCLNKKSVRASSDPDRGLCLPTGLMPIVLFFCERSLQTACARGMIAADEDRRVAFDELDAVARLRGQPVTLEVRLRNADLYTIRFE